MAADSWWIRGLRRWGLGPNAHARNIPEPLWQSVLDQHPFLTWRSPDELQQLRQRCSEFLRRKEFFGLQEFTVTDTIALSIAAQACVAIIHLPLSLYDDFVGIRIHPGPLRLRQEVVDDAGVVHESEEELVGQAQSGGPMLLCWDDGLQASIDTAHSDATTAFNLVVHEFAHVLDGADGVMDGCPPMPHGQRRAWLAELQTAFDAWDERRVCAYPSVLDAYGAVDTVEFFAVVCEAFFTRPHTLQTEMPVLYRMYSSYFRQDPAAFAPAAD